MFWTKSLLKVNSEQSLEVKQSILRLQLEFNIEDLWKKHSSTLKQKKFYERRFQRCQT